MAPINRVAAVAVDDATIEFRWAGGSTATVELNGLDRVLIRTTDDGPFDDDLFFVVEAKGKSYVIPQDATGAGQLVELLQTLPGFDNESVIESMSSTDNKEFVCWQRAGNGSDD